MASTWQIKAIVTCALIFGVVSALDTHLSKVSYSPAKQSTKTGSQPRSSQSLKSVTDLTSASSTTTIAKSKLPAQPTVYHSIIDRSATATQLASPVQATASTVGDLHTAAGHHHGHAHGKYYDYREVPKKKTWKAGYKRGNHKHTIERHEHGKAGKHPHFKAKVKWHDKKSKGKGIHLWDYNHHDKKHYHHG